MEGYCSTGQRPQRAVVPVEEEELIIIKNYYQQMHLMLILFNLKHLKTVKY
jgi:hypothetical protein